MSRKQVNAALHRFYKCYDTSYIDTKGYGKYKYKFMKWCLEHGYDSDKIEEELQNEDTDPEFLNFNPEFPASGHEYPYSVRLKYIRDIFN